MKAQTSILSLGAAALSLPTTFARDQTRQSPLLRRERASTSTSASTHPRLESREEQPGLFSVSVNFPSDHDDADGDVDTRQRQRRRAEGVRKLEEMQSCRLYLEDMHYNAGNPQDSVEKWICTFENYVTEDSGVPFPYALELAGDTDSIKEFFDHAGVESGHSYLHWDSPQMVSINEEESALVLNDELSTVSGTGVWVHTNEPIEIMRSRKLKTTGTMKAIVVRIVGDGVAPVSSLSKLQEEIYGTGLSLKSQMQRCSHGQLVIEPFSGFGTGYFQHQIQGGVIELRLTVNPLGQSDKQMENYANQAASYVLGDLASQFDLVMFVIPPGISPGFAAYAYIGTPYSYYLNENIEDLMIQMHEVGHNLGLQHAGEGSPGSLEAEYGDNTGYMGYTSTEDPSMCFNAANNYQLGWYSQHTVDPTSGGEFSGRFVMSGVAGYNPNDPSKLVTLRLEQPRLTEDYYIGFNWAFGMNTGTQEDRDKVLITEKRGNVHESSLSWKKAALSVGESFVIRNYDGSGRNVIVTFVEITLNDAIVDVELERKPTLAPSSSPTRVTAAPSSTPTDITMTCDDENVFRLNVRTDQKPWENKWKFKEDPGRWIGGVEFDTPNTEYEYKYCLEYDTCYIFMFFDEMQDGLGDSPEGGYYEVYIGGELRYGKRGSGEWERKKVYNFCTLPSLGLNETSSILENDFDFDLYFGNETVLMYSNETDLTFGNETDLTFGNETDFLDRNETVW
eukprot:jgi/Psemu1/254716/estExt_Genewise1Plus.C_1090013